MKSMEMQRTSTRQTVNGEFVRDILMLESQPSKKVGRIKVDGMEQIVRHQDNRKEMPR